MLVINHILESSLGLTLGGLLLKLFEQACKKPCSEPNVQTVAEEQEVGRKVSDASSNITIIPNYDTNKKSN